MGVFCAMRYRLKLLRPFVLEESSLDQYFFKKNIGPPLSY